MIKNILLQLQGLCTGIHALSRPKHIVNLHFQRKFDYLPRTVLFIFRWTIQGNRLSFVSIPCTTWVTITGMHWARVREASHSTPWSSLIHSTFRSFDATNSLSVIPCLLNGSSSFYASISFFLCYLWLRQKVPRSKWELGSKINRKGKLNGKGKLKRKGLN